MTRVLEKSAGPSMAISGLGDAAVLGEPMDRPENKKRPRYEGIADEQYELQKNVFSILFNFYFLFMC